MKPLCFVLMPFGIKKDSSGMSRDFNAVYRDIICPAVQAAGMEPVRADEEAVGGWIHKPMFERLMLCDYAVADLTGENPNVFYELGIRHALRPHSTVVIFQEGSVLPFDVAPLRGFSYDLSAAAGATAGITARLTEAREHHDDSPVYQFLVDLPRPQIDHSKTDIFRDQVEYSNQARIRLASARSKGSAGREDVMALWREFGNLADAEMGTVIDMFLSLRAIEAFDEMPKLFEAMPVPLQRSPVVREQLALALNRLGRHGEAEKILKELIAKSGPNPETNGILGRVYKDQYGKANAAGDAMTARGWLKKAIEAYTAGFEADWRDAYPGVNAVTLMEMSTPPDSRQAELLPMVRYAAKRQMAARGGDYWDHATLLELAVLGRDREAAEEHLCDTLAHFVHGTESFRARTTAKNLGLIRAKREKAGEDCGWLLAIEQRLIAEADAMLSAAAPV